MNNALIALFLVMVLMAGCTQSNNAGNGMADDVGGDDYVVDAGDEPAADPAEPAEDNSADEPSAPPALPDKGMAETQGNTYTNPLTGAVVLGETRIARELVTTENKVLAQRGLNVNPIANSAYVVATDSQETVDYAEVVRENNEKQLNSIPYEFRIGTDETTTTGNAYLWTCIETVVKELNQKALNYEFESTGQYAQKDYAQIHDTQNKEASDAAYIIAQYQCIYLTGKSPSGDLTKWECYKGALARTGKDYVAAAKECYGT